MMMGGPIQTFPQGHFIIIHTLNIMHVLYTYTYCRIRRLFFFQEACVGPENSKFHRQGLPTSALLTVRASVNIGNMRRNKNEWQWKHRKLWQLTCGHLSIRRPTWLSPVTTFMQTCSCVHMRWVCNTYHKVTLQTVWPKTKGARWKTGPPKPDCMHKTSPHCTLNVITKSCDHYLCTHIIQTQI